MNKWISVKDELPEDDDLYIVYDEQAERVWFMYYYARSFQSADSDGEPYVNNEDITHWMSLPGEPK